jgi:hypothetical protein
LRFRVGILAVLAGGALTSGQGGVAAPLLEGPGVIKITARQIERQVNGTNPGDVEVTRMRLYNTRVTHKPIGHGELVCVFVEARTLRNCSATFTLPKGKIVVGGSIVRRDTYELAVLGGTRLYANVQGTLTVTSLPGKQRTYLLLFHLLT